MKGIKLLSIVFMLASQNAHAFMFSAVGVATSNDSAFSGKTFYVCDEGGSDSNSGSLAISSLSSIEAVNYKTKEGDRVLFCGGGDFTGKLWPQQNEITYGVYNAVSDFVGTASIADNVLTVVSKTSGGDIGIGSKVMMNGLYHNFFGADLPVYIVGLGTGTGGTGTYYINPNLPDGETLTVATTSVTIGGKKPVVSGSGTDVALNIVGKSDITIDGLVFTNDSYRVGNVTVSSEIDNLAITNSAFIQTTAINETYNNILHISTTAPFHDFTFEDNLVVGPSYSYSINQEGVNITHLHEVYNLSVKNNAFYNINASGLRIWQSNKATIVAGNYFPHEIVLEDNVFSNIAHDAINMMTGVLGTSSVSRNTAYNIGTDETPYVNAIQSGYWVGSIVEYNDVRNVYTSMPDGIGIIIDFAWADSAYKSSGLKVRYNHVTGCNSSHSSGISNWVGSDNEIYGNISHHNTYGITLALSSSTGNKFYNNTLVYNYSGGNIDTGGYSAAPASEWFNNIIAFNENYGFRINQSTFPTENNNLFYGNGSGNFSDSATPDQSDVLSDPLLVADTYDISSGSPAIGAGIIPEGQSSITGIDGVSSTVATIGAYQ